jgi:hypothetical protein
MRTPSVLHEAEICRLPRPAEPLLTPQTFVMCPVQSSFVQFNLQRELYRLALEQARAIVRPSLPERDLLAVWN